MGSVHDSRRREDRWRESRLAQGAAVFTLSGLRRRVADRMRLLLSGLDCAARLEDSARPRAMWISSSVPLQGTR